MHLPSDPLVIWLFLKTWQSRYSVNYNSWTSQRRYKAGKLQLVNVSMTNFNREKKDYAVQRVRCMRQASYRQSLYCTFIGQQCSHIQSSKAFNSHLHILHVFIAFTTYNFIKRSASLSLLIHHWNCLSFNSHLKTPHALFTL